MGIRKTIKVFLASSEELKDEREKFGNLIRRLDDRYLKRGIHVQLICWEDLDPCYYENVRKQDEYNAMIRQCDIFVCLFYTKAGQYTREELDVARQENERRREPQIMVYLRDLQPDDVEQPDLVEFKQTLEHEMHQFFWGHYPTTDKLHLDFVMFLLNREGDSDVVQVENGDVVFDGLPIASMDNLPFASENAGYKQMKAELEALPKQIEKLRQRVERYPDDEEFRDELQEKLNRYNALKDQFTDHQKALFATAKRISEMQLQKVSSELKRAIEAFEAGNVEAANAILDGIEREAERHLEQLDRDRELIHQDIEALQLKTKTLMADVSISIEERIQQTWETYKKADDWAERSALPKEKYAILLYEYAYFLWKYAKLDEVLEVCTRECRMNEELYGIEHPNTAMSYNNIGMVYYNQGNYDLALEYYQKALDIYEKIQGVEQERTATSYNNIGLVYHVKGNYNQTLEYLQKALDIYEKVLGVEHERTAGFYNNIGVYFASLGDYMKALEFYSEALDIYEKVLGVEHELTAVSYSNIGKIYYYLDEYDQALEYYLKALEIFEKVLGAEHPDTAALYNNIGMVYFNWGDNDQALEYYHKALKIHRKILGENNSNTATSYNNIGSVYFHCDINDLALVFLMRALEIRLNVFGAMNPDTAMSYNNIGNVYSKQGNYDQALEYLQKALEINEKVLGEEHPFTAKSNCSIGSVYDELGEYGLALKYYKKALEIQQERLGAEHCDTATSYNNIGMVYYKQGNYDQALEYYQKALEIFEKALGAEHPYTKTVKENIELLKTKMEE